MTNEEIFDMLRTKGQELSDWLSLNFNMHTAIVITGQEVKIVQTEYCQMTQRD
jgi:hypothetical protein